MKILIPVILCFVCISCQPPQDTYSHLTENRERIHISNVVKDIILYPLEANEDFLIGKIDKFLCKDSSFFILDNRYNKALYQFHINGKGLNKYQNPGRGPFEYTAINDFDFLPEHQGIILCTPMKLILLDTDFVPRKEIILEQYYDRMICSGNNVFMYCHHDACVDVLNLKTNNINRVFSGKAMPGNVFYIQPVFYRTEQHVYFQASGDDCIYQVDTLKFTLFQKLGYKEKERAFKLYSTRKADQISTEELATHPLIHILDIRENNGISFIYECMGFGINRPADSLQRTNHILTGFIGNSSCFTRTEADNLFTWRSVITEKDSINGIPIHWHHSHFNDPEMANPVILRYDFK